MLRISFRGLAPVLTLFLSTVVAAEPPADSVKAGEAKAATCMACHGIAGISNSDMWPNLAGQKRGYMIKTIKEYRDGTREDIMMTPMSKGLSDQDIADLATYYASLRPE
jgi:cytochrome c553